MASCWAPLAPRAPWLVLLSLSCPSTDRSRSAGACRPRGERSDLSPPGPARTREEGKTPQALSARRKGEAWDSSADELLVADQPDLRQAQPLRGGHQHRHALVLHQLVELHGVRLDGNGDDEHDEQHEHYVDERSGVDVHHHLRLLPAACAKIHRHNSLTPRAALLAPAVP